MDKFLKWFLITIFLGGWYDHDLWWLFNSVFLFVIFGGEGASTRGRESLTGSPNESKSRFHHDTRDHLKASPKKAFFLIGGCVHACVYVGVWGEGAGWSLLTWIWLTSQVLIHSNPLDSHVTSTTHFKPLHCQAYGLCFFFSFPPFPFFFCWLFY